MLKFTKLIPIILVIFATVLNLVILFPETTARSELNDNVFAFVLVSQMNNAWDTGKCPFSLGCLPALTDHWVSTFALGFPLPHYYQHLPHLAAVTLYRSLSWLNANLSLFVTFEWFKYLLLAVFPFSVFWAAKKLELPPLAAGFSALLSPLISTQYLYGTDFNAVLWRGSGMYTQLWGFFAAPLALGSLYDTIKYRRSLVRSSLLLALTFSGHLVFGYIVLLTSPLIVLSTAFTNFTTPKEFIKLLFRPLTTLVAVVALTFALLSYWAVPLILDSAWHNSHSPWDSREKFDSYGMLAVTQKLVNGDLFDANRLPVLTLLVAVGFFSCLFLFFQSWESKINHLKIPASYLLLPLTFIFWYFLYWGRATWGSLIDLLPLSEGIHLHRFINGLHLPGIFLSGLGLSLITLNLIKAPKFLKLPGQISPKIVGFLFSVTLTTTILYPIYQERLKYVKDNSGLITEANKYISQDYPDFLKTVEFLKQKNPPTGGRIWVGRPGNWGNDFNIGPVHAFMQFSMSNIDVSGFLPETWSPNSDVEQFFDETRLDHYQAYGLKTIVAPPDREVPKEAKKIAQFGKFVIYDVPEITEFEIGSVPFQIVSDKKMDFSLLRLWLLSTWPSYHTHPAISLTNQPFTNSSISTLPILRMLNMNNYSLNASPPTSLFANNPFSQNPKEATPGGTIVSENRNFGNYSAIVSSQNSKDTYIILKVSYNPSWRAYLDNQPTVITPVAPVFMAVQLPVCTEKIPCNHTVEFRYEASPLKKILLVISLGTLITAVTLRKRLNQYFSS